MIAKFFFFLALVIYSFDVTLASDHLTKILPEFEKYIEKVQADWGAPGIAVGIVKDGKVVYIKTFGVREVGIDKKIDEHTVFQIASLTKNILVHLYAKLVQEGKVKWDDPVTKYMPNFFIGNAEVTQKFTIRDLMSHRSGLPSFSGDTLWQLDFSADEIIQGMAKIPLKRPFHSKYGYQNQLFGMASMIAEKITGKTIETLFKEYFFTPMQLTDSSVGISAIKPEESLLSRLFHRGTELNIAHPHDDRGNSPNLLELSPLIYRFPGSTGANMSISDLSQWMIFMLNKGVYKGNTLIDEKQYDELLIPNINCAMQYDDSQFPGDRYEKVEYSMGHFIMRYGEGKRFVTTRGHMGGFYGTRSLMVVVPEEQLGIVVLSNYGSFRVSFVPEAIHNKFMDLYLELSDIDWSKRLKDNFDSIKKQNKTYKSMQRLQRPKTARILQDYTGTFKNELYGELSLVEESNILYLMFRGKKIPLEHFNGNEFTFPGYLLSEAYCEGDVGYIEFGARDGQKLNVCAISSLIDEGKDQGIFERTQ
ncbi:MAG: serine hydrolase domain-containing protein [Pseudomonadota bacterium]